MKITIEAGRSESHYWKDLWRYRELFYFLAWRDLLVRYKQTVIGVAWAVLRPLLTMLALTLVFGKLAKLPSDGVPYPILVFAALLPWHFFASSFSEAGNSLINNSNMISKVYFPRLVIPISAVASAFVDFCASFLVLIAMMLFFRVAPTWAVLSLPLWLLLAAATALGVGLWLASLAVKYHDVALALNFGIEIWKYLTPVAYSITLIPEQWRWLYSLNPMTQVVEGFRWALLGTSQPPNWTTVVSSALVLVLLVTGAFYFRRTERTIVDVF